MAPGKPEVIDLCDDDDDAPPASLSTKSKPAQHIPQKPTGPKQSRLPVIDISGGPERASPSKKRPRDSHPSSQASDVNSPNHSLNRKKRKQEGGSSSFTKSHEARQERQSADLNDGTASPSRARRLGPEEAERAFHSYYISDPVSDHRSSSPLKRARDTEALSSDGALSDKRQKLFKAHSQSRPKAMKDAVPSSQNQLKSIAKANLKTALNGKKTSGAVIDLTSDGEEPQQDGQKRSNADAVVANGAREVRKNGVVSPQAQKTKSIEGSQRRSETDRRELHAKPAAQSKSSPLRNKSARPSNFRKGGPGTAKGQEGVDEQWPEIPESLPNSPEKEGGAQATPVEQTQAASRSSPGIKSWRNSRPLPLTPSESSADEESRKKDRAVQKLSATASAVKATEKAQSSTGEEEVTHGLRSVTGNTAPSKETERMLRPPEARESGTSALNSKLGQSQKAKVSGSTIPAHLSANMSTAKQIERSTGSLLDELRRDNEHWTRLQLQRARCSIDNRPNPPKEEPTSVFSELKCVPVQVNDKKKSHRGLASFEVEMSAPRGNNKKVTWTAPCNMFNADGEDVPPYSHFVGLKHNFLAANETTLQHWPYFDDETNSRPQLSRQFGKLYDLDVAHRETKLLHMTKAEHFAEHAEFMLEEVQCEWSDVLRFLLEPTPEVGTDPEAQRALKSRDEFSDLKVFRQSERWSALVDKLPKPVPKKTGKAGLLCETFFRLTRFSFWHLARRSDYTRSLLGDNAQPDIPSDDQLTCRVCMRFNCPYHGEIENPNDDGDEHQSEASSESVVDTVDTVETDIINPPTVNYRTRVALPPALDDNGSGSGKDRRSAHYWQSGMYASLLTKPDERNPFYPCYHPGLPCSAADCSCYTNRIPCEKSCACTPDCPRKFQGCNCSKVKNGRVCSEDESCACWMLGRECDPDLCGTCGVRDVLDPKHRHDDRVLARRCHAASIQRGAPKHTVLGRSGVHGFGLYACEDIRQDEFIGEYKGELITSKESERRGAVYEHQKLSYLFSLNKSQEVDSTFFGNKMRFINHATKAKCNVYARIIMVNTVHRIGMYAKREIRAGEEIYFDYGPCFTFADDQKGGKRGTIQDQNQSKAVPHVRNANITKTFWDPDEDEVEDEDEGDSDQRTRGRGRPSKPSQQGRKGVRPAANKLPRLFSSSSDVEMAEAGDESDEWDEQDVEEEEDEE